MCHNGHNKIPHSRKNDKLGTAIATLTNDLVFSIINKTNLSAYANADKTLSTTLSPQQLFLAGALPSTAFRVQALGCRQTEFGLLCPTEFADDGYFPRDQIPLGSEINSTTVVTTPTFQRGGQVDFLCVGPVLSDSKEPLNSTTMVEMKRIRMTLEGYTKDDGSKLQTDFDCSNQRGNDNTIVSSQLDIREVPFDITLYISLQQV